MAHKTGAAFSTGHIPHGCANAIYLPYVIQYNAKDQTAKERYAAIARSVGITGSDSECVAKLCKKIDEYNVKLNIPKTLQEFGIVEAEFKEKVAKIAELAVGDACTGSNLYILWDSSRILNQKTFLPLKGLLQNKIFIQYIVNILRYLYFIGY